MKLDLVQSTMPGARHIITHVVDVFVHLNLIN
jgi:hypothetical protein